MPSSDREVFEALTNDPAHSEISNFLTYALFAFDRREWIAYIAAERGEAPTQAAIDEWTANLSPHAFDQIRLRATSFFEFAARDYMADDIEAARQETLQGAVVREVMSATEAQKLGLAATLTEVKAAGAFRKQFSIALLTAILAPLLIGAAIGAALIFSDRFPSLREIAAASAVRGQAKPPAGQP